MTQTKLIVCGDIEKQADLKVLMASIDDLNVLLFKSISRYLINPRMLSGKVATSENLSITLKNEKVMEIPRIKRIYGKDTSIGTLVYECFEELKKNEKSVLLMSKDVDFDRKQLNHMVKIVFK